MVVVPNGAYAYERERERETIKVLGEKGKDARLD